MTCLEPSRHPHQVPARNPWCRTMKFRVPINTRPCAFSRSRNKTGYERTSQMILKIEYDALLLTECNYVNHVVTTKTSMRSVLHLWRTYYGHNAWRTRAFARRTRTNSFPRNREREILSKRTSMRKTGHRWFRSILCYLRLTNRSFLISSCENLWPGSWWCLNFAPLKNVMGYAVVPFREKNSSLPFLPIPLSLGGRVIGSELHSTSTLT